MDSTTYITRKTDLFDHSPDKEITLQEWMAMVANDPEMRLDNYTTVKLWNGEDYRYPSPGTAVFLSREPGQSTIREIVFDFVAGSIIIKNADQKAMDKIRLLAFKLNARIFRETKISTEQIPLEQLIINPRFSFSDLLVPFKKSIPQLRYLFQQLAFAFSRNSQEK
jgi:hypothetical protein